MRLRGTPLVLSLAVPLLLAAPASGAFSGANGRIAFSLGGSFSGPSDLDPSGQFSSIADIAAGGFGERTLRHCTETEGEPPEGNCSIEYRSPAYSPGGRLIAFDAGSRLALMRSDGSGLRLLPAQTGDDGEPAFSPDGRRLVFTGRDGPADAQSARLYVLVLASGRVRRLTRAPSTEAAWSVRGRIAFSRGTGVYAIRPNGKGLRRLTSGSSPDWSPGGRRLALVRDGVIYILSGGRARRLRGTGQAVGNPVWSPDGRRIAFDSDSGIATIGIQGHVLRLVRENQSGDSGGSAASQPAWQPVPR